MNARRRLNHESRWTKVNGLTMHARVAVNQAPRDTPTVVLVHGLGMSHRYMMPTLVELAPHAHVYAIDLPGFGKSDKPIEAFDVRALADALDGWMAATNLCETTLVGNSFGCQIIADLAARRSARIERLVLVAPTIDAHARTVRQQLVRLILDAPHEPLSLVPLAFREYFITVGFSRALQTLRYAVADRIEEKLPRIILPTLVVRGERDALVPQAWAEEMTRLLPLGSLAVIDNAAHAVNYDKPRELVRLMLPFIMR